MSPRLQGYRETLYGNFYDAVPILRMADDHHRLFSNQNVGIKHLTNMTCAGQLGPDQTFVLVNVYVRTNLGRTRPTLGDAKRKEVRDLFVDDNNDDAIGTLMRECQWERTQLVRALEEWAHTATVTVVIGNKPMLTMNAHDLMDGPALGPGRQPECPLPKDADGKVARMPWRKQLDPVMIVPVRQNISVQIDSTPLTTRELKRLATEAGVLPEPLVWVHLEGLQSREIW